MILSMTANVCRIRRQVDYQTCYQDRSISDVHRVPQYRPPRVGGCRALSNGELHNAFVLEAADPLASRLAVGEQN